MENITYGLCWKIHDKKETLLHHSSDFLRSTQNLKKLSSWFGRLLSKCIKHEEGCANFCVLLRKSEL